MPTDDWTVRRNAMVREQILRRGVVDSRLLEAMQRVPRERFVPEQLQHRAYADRALAIGYGQTISQPFMVAVMTQSLALEAGDRVLEVGTGSGYQAAILSELDAHVYTIERVADLAADARARLDELGYGDVRVRAGDGSIGWPDAAPFAAILVAAAAPVVPPPLLEQLDPAGGRLVAPVGDRDLQDLVRVVRDGNSWVREKLMGCRFVPLLGEEGWSDV